MNFVSIIMGSKSDYEIMKNCSDTFEKFNVRTTIDQPFRWNDRLYLAPIQNAEVYKNPQMVQAYGY
mgnify:CR=1 FL=1